MAVQSLMHETRDVVRVLHTLETGTDLSKNAKQFDQRLRFASWHRDARVQGPRCV